MTAIELLGATLISAMMGWLAVRFLMSRSALQGRRRRRGLVAIGAFNTVTFLTAFVVLRSCAERCGASTPVARDRREQSVPPDSIIDAPATSPELASKLASLQSPPTLPAEQSASESERQDHYRGYRAGYALATDSRHRGSRVPPTWVLDAIVNQRSKGQGPGFSDGFKQGYITGLAARKWPVSDNRSKQLYDLRQGRADLTGDP